MHNYKYGITPAELKEARKFIIQDIKSNNDCSTNFSWCMTLQNYLNFCKEILMGSVNEEGFLLESDGSYRYNPKLFIDRYKSKEKGLQAYKKQKYHDTLKEIFCKNRKIQLLKIKYSDNIDIKLKEALYEKDL